MSLNEIYTDEFPIDYNVEFQNQNEFTPVSNIINGEIVENDEEDEINEKTNPTINLLGLELDADTVWVSLLLMIIWVSIWASTGLFKTFFPFSMVKLTENWYFLMIFVLLSFYMIASIYTSGTSSGGIVYELNILLTVEQMVSILFGTMVVFLLFSHYFREKFGVHENCMKVVNKIAILIVIVLTASSLWVNLAPSGRTFRQIRKFKQGVYNIALSLFVVIGFILYRGIQDGQCEQLV